MEHEQRLEELDARIAQLARNIKRHGWRSRWAAIGAAVAVAIGGGTALHFAAAAPGDVVATSFVPVTPVRILDTRPTSNVGGFVGPLIARQTLTFQVSGVAGVPASASAVVMNVTVDATTASSFLTVFPAGAAQPTASNLNWVAGTTIPNLVTIKLGDSGRVSVFNNSGNTHVIADVAGYYVPGNDKFISLDVTGSPSDTAVFNSGSGAVAGLAFADAALDDASFHIVLPPDYTSGTAIVGAITWHTSTIFCNVSWRAGEVSVSRSGQSHVATDVGAMPMTDPVPGTTGDTTNRVQTSTFTLNSPSGSFTLQPGDSYTFRLFREGTAVGDTCASVGIIDSMVIRYD